MALLQSIKKKLLGDTVEVKFVVHVPGNTPPGDRVYLTGGCSALGDWRAAGRQLRQTDRKVYEGRVRVPAGQPIEFKVTRGSWESVESHGDGGGTENHYVTVEQMTEGPVYHTVERWNDA
ncbi:MAG: CBM20 domain-containing protein [Planctomycetota bacterium]